MYELNCGIERINSVLIDHQNQTQGGHLKRAHEKKRENVTKHKESSWENLKEKKKHLL